MVLSRSSSTGGVTSPGPDCGYGRHAGEPARGAPRCARRPPDVAATRLDLPVKRGPSPVIIAVIEGPRGRGAGSLLSQLRIKVRNRHDATGLQIPKEIESIQDPRLLPTGLCYRSRQRQHVQPT